MARSPWASTLYRAEDWARPVATPPRATRAKYRSDPRRDYARLIHSPAFRRLQGKTQLFPGGDSDFFRNRLTHSMEVAQIAKSIALKLNAEHRDGPLKGRDIDCNLVEFAGLAHDLGHPPFGHNGEEALDEKMRAHGGFEGNAQTLRILARLEKKAQEDDGSSATLDLKADPRRGLALTYRSYAAVLKYDRVIPDSRKAGDKLAKGYYSTERKLVAQIKSAVLGPYRLQNRDFRTIECDIMDIADDIAYSTYDLEDSLKAEFVSPLDFLAPPIEVLEHVAKETSKSIRSEVTPLDAHRILLDLIRPQLTDSSVEAGDMEASLFQAVVLARTLQRDGYSRTTFTSKLVDGFIDGVELDFFPKCPPLSRIRVKSDALRQIEVLKHFNFAFTIMSPRVKLTAYRGREIVGAIFDALMDEKHGGQLLLPDDVRKLWGKVVPAQRSRVICDFIAGMTDSYAVEFYARLKSEVPRSIFKPH